MKLRKEYQYTLFILNNNKCPNHWWAPGNDFKLCKIIDKCHGVRVECKVVFIPAAQVYCQVGKAKRLTPVGLQPTNVLYKST